MKIMAKTVKTPKAPEIIIANQINDQKLMLNRTKLSKQTKCIVKNGHKLIKQHK